MDSASNIRTQAGTEALTEVEGPDWAVKNAQAIEAYNFRVEGWGVFSDGPRVF
jgi:hypothetical protein